MKQTLKLAIVGRPNVGKSALFNRICGKRLAIVDEAEGVTRDRIYSDADFFGMPFQVIDTGGINPRSQAAFNSEIKRQAEIAIEEADTIVMVVDTQVGITDLDLEIARILLRTKKPLCLAANKVDDLSQEHLIYPFQSLGIKHVVAVSAAHGWHIAELLEAAFEDFDRSAIEREPNPSIKIAIVGRPNVGKSSLVNYLLNEERCIVSPIPGTTRDSIDVSFTLNEDLYTFIDTAGIRRKQSEHEVVDKFAAMRTERAIERCDICLLMLDAQQGMTTQEKKIANLIEESGKGCILLLNKWDLVKGFRMEHCLRGVEEEVPFLNHCPKIFISVKTGRNVEKIFPTVKSVYDSSQQRITTHQLNKFIGSCLQKNHPPMIMGKRLRIYYMAQVGIQPPIFVLFVNYPNLMSEAYKKYLYNQFREIYGFLGVPIIFRLKGKAKDANRKSKHAPETHEEGYIDNSSHSSPNYEDIEGLDEEFEDFDEYEDDSSVDHPSWNS